MKTTPLILALVLSACANQVDYPSLEEPDADTDVDADTDPDIQEDGWQTSDPSDTFAWGEVTSFNYELIDGPGGQVAPLDLHADGDRVIASDGMGMYLSDNAGASWWRAENLPVSTFSWTVGVSDGAHFVGTSDGTFHSLDNGETWVESTGAEDTYRAIFSTGGAGVFAVNYSKNLAQRWDGDGWTTLEVPTPDAHTFELFAADDTLYLMGLSYQNLYASDDGGESWTLQSEGSVSRIYFEEDDGTLYGGQAYGTAIKRSEDGGVTWTSVGTIPLVGPKHPNGLVFRQGEDLYAVSQTQGMYVSSDDGQSWTDATAGLPTDAGRQIRDMVQVTDGSFLAATVVTGLWKKEQGKDFVDSDMGLGGGTVLDMAWTENGWVTAFYMGGVGLLGADETWTTIMEPDSGVRVDRVATTADATVLVTTYDGLLHSNDLQNWTTVGGDLPKYNGSAGNQTMPMGRLDVRGSWIFAPVRQMMEGSARGPRYPVGGGAALSWDDGSTWEYAIWDLPIVASNGSATAYESGSAIRAYADRVLLGTNGAGIYLSLDRAETWEPSTGIPDTTYVSAIAAANGEHLASAWDSKVGGGLMYRSTDGGVTWEVGGEGLDEGVLILSMVDADDTVFGLGYDEEGWELWHRVDGVWTLRIDFPEDVRISEPLVQYGEDMFVSSPGMGLLRITPGS